MEVNPFLKRMMKAKTEDVIHSSAYAGAQNGGGMGATSTESFAHRMKVDQNRRVIKGYSDSSVVTRSFGNGPKAKTYTPPTNNGGGLGPRTMGPKNPGISR